MARYVLLDASNIIQGIAAWDGVAPFSTPPGLTKRLLPDPPPPFRTGDTYNTVNDTVTPRADTADEAVGKNYSALIAKGTSALAANSAFLALPSPTNLQTLAQVQLLTKQVNALMRLATRILDSTNDT